MAGTVGWYALKSGQPFYGVLPAGATEIDPPAPVDIVEPERQPAKVGWYQLPAGAVFYGTVPAGATEVPEPTGDIAAPDPKAKVAEWRTYASRLARNDDEQAAIAKMPKAQLIERYGSAQPVEQPVDSGESGTTVGTEVPGDELGPDPEQLGTGPLGSPGEQSLEDESAGHDEES